MHIIWGLQTVIATCPSMCSSFSIFAVWNVLSQPPVSHPLLQPRPKLYNESQGANSWGILLTHQFVESIYCCHWNSPAGAQQIIYGCYGFLLSSRVPRHEYRGFLANCLMQVLNLSTCVGNTWKPWSTYRSWCHTSFWPIYMCCTSTLYAILSIKYICTTSTYNLPAHTLSLTAEPSTHQLSTFTDALPFRYRLNHDAIDISEM